MINFMPQFLWSLMGAMLGTISKSKADLSYTCMFFQQGGDQCVCMHAVSPADIIPTYDFPVLYFNGSEDYRDSKEKWLRIMQG